MAMLLALPAAETPPADAPAETETTLATVPECNSTCTWPLASVTPVACVQLPAPEVHA